MLKNVGIIVLAAGKGSRLKCTDRPKVLYPIGGQPIVSYILREFKDNNVDSKQVYLIVGFMAEQVKKELKNGFNYVMQNERKGTAHAAHIGEAALAEDIDTMLVMNGDDSAFYTYESLNYFIEEHKKNDCDISLLTCEPKDPQGLGRVVRDNEGEVSAVVEKENMNEEHKKIKEISTGTFCFKRSWFAENFKTLKPIPNLGEYGLPSFIDIAIKTKAKFKAVKLKDAEEWFGINTIEQLAKADERKKEQNN